ncbi:MAG: hypothetical protein LQ351_001276 [Letrouitia transgressa]|nr:MAG: hypothetical protein LQ351_001276 [Letrouitia transgressa]
MALPLAPGSQRLLNVGFALSTFLRSIGLELLNVVVRGKIHTHATELKKPVIQTSKWLALARCGVHIIPLLFSIILVTLNVKGFFIGHHLQGVILADDINLALLQVAAKVQELLIVASTSTIVFDIIRSELLHGNGVPLGLIGSGFSFGNLSWFWSADFWCSIRYKTQWWRKTFLLVTLSFAGLLAVTAGPATAVLAVPRPGTWPAGGSSFFLRGTDVDIWPSHLNYSSDQDPPFCRGPNPMRYAVCPSGGFYSFLAHHSQVNTSDFMNRPRYDWNYGDSNFNLKIHDPSAQIPKILTLGDVRSDRNFKRGRTWFTQPHIPSVVYLKQLTIDWSNATESVPWSNIQDSARYHYGADLQSQILTQNPVVHVECSKAQNVSIGRFVPLLFPTMEGHRNEILLVDIPRRNAHLPMGRFSWVDLNPPKWKNATAGALFTFYPNDKRGSQTQDVLAISCTVRAAWQKAHIVHGGHFSYAFTSYDLKGGTKRPLTVSSSWLEALTPFMSNRDTNNYSPSILMPIKSYSNDSSDSSLTPNITLPNTMEILIAQAQVGSLDPATATESNQTITMSECWNIETFGVEGNRTTFLEYLLASVFADGLSRTGSVSAFTHTDLPLGHWSLWNYNPVPNFHDSLLQGGNALERPKDGQTFTESRVNVTISGYKYDASATTDYLAIAVIIFHGLVALAHTVYCFICGASSSSWDSISEILTLALGSRVEEKVLQNTGAGIKTGNTFKIKAWIRVRRGRVMLVFEEADDDNVKKDGAEQCEEFKVEAETVGDVSTPVQSRNDSDTPPFPSGDPELALSRDSETSQSSLKLARAGNPRTINWLCSPIPLGRGSVGPAINALSSPSSHMISNTSAALLAPASRLIRRLRRISIRSGRPNNTSNSTNVTSASAPGPATQMAKTTALETGSGVEISRVEADVPYG